MAKILGNFIMLLLLLIPTAVIFNEQAKGSNLAFAQDVLEGEDDEATVETETGADEDTPEEETPLTGNEKEEEPVEEESTALKPSPDADTFILFTKPTNPKELPAGKQVRILVGFTNNGNLDFLVDSMEASFRYPQDYSFFLQNFTTAVYNAVVEPKRQATFEYVFVPNEAFSARPFGLTVTLNYKNKDGSASFQSAVFNETIQVVDPDEGLDGETFFLYVFLAAIIILLLVGAQQLVSSFGRKRLSKPRKPVELGTQNSDVDYDWLPKETLQGLSKSPRRSPKQSPRQRRNLRSTGSKEE
ncbi:translocon-associated protein subunit alpha [Biomphalaria pfeifferi]|uniref:Translocon-associated protein subunit alpha n=1 Tax=Biomphalaria pfeifferi TaxID=112525 RepID=A0AAD8AY05_BIOPF|nr:translocon-associated protein subunit alpha [Biomphalaria pfeifferi]